MGKKADYYGRKRRIIEEALLVKYAVGTLKSTTMQLHPVLELIYVREITNSVTL